MADPKYLTPEEKRQRWTAYRYIKRHVEKPDMCEHCGMKGAVEAHHPAGYTTFKRVVIWLCRACHIQEDRRWEKYRSKDKEQSVNREAS